MANTLTLVEFDALKTRSLDGIFNAIVVHRQSRMDGCSDCKCNHLKELVLYAKVLQSWEQDKFNYLQFTNFLNSNSIQFIFNRINKLL